ADRGPTRHVDVNVRRVLRVGQQRVCVRATTRLHRGDGLGMRDVGNVEDADAAHAVLAYRIRHALSAAVEPAVEVLAGYEEEVAVHRDVVLRVGTNVGRHQHRLGRLRDVPHLQPVEVPLDDVVSGKGEIRVEKPEVARVGIVREL